MTSSAAEAFATEVRLYVFGEAAETGRVPQSPQIAAALERPRAEVDDALKALAAGRVLMLAPNDGEIWAANPFCAVPSAFRVEARDKRYRAICIWDALGVLAALGEDGVVRAICGDCGDPMEIEIREGKLARGDGLIHFAVPARRWWDNIGFT